VNAGNVRWTAAGGKMSLDSGIDLKEREVKRGTTGKNTKLSYSIEYDSFA
jgi:hypothetical protein